MVLLLFDVYVVSSYIHRKCNGEETEEGSEDVTRNKAINNTDMEVSIIILSSWLHAQD